MVASPISTSAIILVAIVAGSVLITWFVPSLHEEPVAASHNHRQLDGFNDPKTVQLRATAANDIVQTDAITEDPYTFRIKIPNVLLIGAQKAGSTSVAEYMFKGGVCRPMHALDWKETHFFDHEDKFKRGAKLLESHFQHCQDHDFIMDATPNTMLFPGRVHDFYKNIGYDLSRLKLIVILREPISRELSLYNYQRAKYSEGLREKWVMSVVRGNKFKSFADSVRVHSMSLYAARLKSWTKLFKRDQLLVLSYDELKEDPKTILWRIQKFLGTTFPEITMPHSNTNQHYTEEVPIEVKQKLDEVFGPKNQQLYQFLDEHPGPWMEQRPFPQFEE